MSVPKLRFPEFKDTEEWEEEKLEYTISTIIPPLKLQTSEYKSYGKYPIIDQSQSYICGWTDNRESLILTDLPLIVFGDHTCALKIIEVPFAQGADGIKIIKPIAKFDTVFFFHSLNNNPIKMEEYKRHFSSLKERIVAYPQTKNEQRKIANCLSSLDDLIAAHSKKLTSLKAHKKGLIQQLFPVEGETVPKLRFPEFRDNGVWERKTVKDTFSIFQGFAFSSDDATSFGTKWLKIADVGIQRMAPESPSYLPYDFSRRFDRFTVHKGDYVIALTRPFLNGELKIASVDVLYDGALLNQRVGKLETTQIFDFVYYLLQTQYLTGRIEDNISGSEPPNLSAQQIESIPVLIPACREEQQKVADCLSSLDKKIVAIVQKIDTLTQQKKGLMQQLFPVQKEESDE